MSDLTERHVQVGRHTVRVLEKGQGPKLGYLPGLIGAPRWLPILDELARDHHVVCPSLPGFPGAEGHEDLDGLLDWITVTLDLLDAANLTGCDLAASSIGAMLALEVAAVSASAVNRLALMAPLGLYSEQAPVPHIWARRSADLVPLLVNDAEELSRLQAAPDGADPVEWNLILSRATAAGARLLWPMCDLGLHNRLHRVRQRTLLIWGSGDQIVRPEYASLFAASIAGQVETATIPNAGHLVELDAPREAAASISRFLRE